MSPPALSSSNAKAKPLVLPNNSNDNRILFLDGVRGLAALLVVIQHSTIVFFGINVGAIAVDAFFVLSSFLVTLRVDREVAQLRQRQATAGAYGWKFLSYAARRFLRIYPLCFLVAILLWFLPADRKQQYFFASKPNYDLFKVLIMQTGYRYHVFWTMPLELMYYCLAPVFVALGVLLGRHAWLAGAPLLCWCFYEGLYVQRCDHQPLRPHIQTFLLGSIFAVGYHRVAQCIHQHQYQFATWLRWGLRLVEYAVLSLLLSITFRSLLFDWVVSDPFPETGGAKFTSIWMLIIIVIELVIPGPLCRMLELNLLRFTAKISFSMCMMHSFVIYSKWIPSYQDHFYDRFFCIFGLVYLISTACYYVVEWPLKKLTKWISVNCDERADAKMLSKDAKKDDDEFDLEQQYVTSPREQIQPEEETMPSMVETTGMVAMATAVDDKEVSSAGRSLPIRIFTKLMPSKTQDATPKETLLSRESM